MTGQSIAFEVMKRSRANPGALFLAFVLLDLRLHQLLTIALDSDLCLWKWTVPWTWEKQSSS